MKIDPNAPAMPCAVSYSGYEVVVAQTDHGLWQAHGLSIRAELAARAMQGILSSGQDIVTYGTPKDIAQMAVSFADGLINALNEEK